MTMTSQLPTNRLRIKRRPGPSFVFAVLTAFAATVAVCATTTGTANAIGDNPKVTYQLTGSSPVADYISYQTDTGQYDQAHVPLPWTTKFKSFGGEVFVISAQGPGSITCTILLDGKVVSNATANGHPARTVCSH
jgi:Mycobacterium membrane protein